MNASEFLEKEAERFGFAMFKSHDGDRDLRVGPSLSKVAHPHSKDASASDLMQLAAILQEAEYGLTFMKDNSIHVHAPHRKEHSWGDRGWSCTHGLTIEGCEVTRVHKKWKDVSTEELITKLQVAIKSRDVCVGDLYRGVAQNEIDEINTVLNTRTLTDTQKLRMGLRGRQMAR